MDTEAPGDPRDVSRRRVLTGAAATLAASAMRGGSAVLKSSIGGAFFSLLGTVASAGIFESVALDEKRAKAFWPRFKNSPVFIPKVTALSEEKPWVLFKIELGPQKRTWFMTCPIVEVRPCRGGFVDDALGPAPSTEALERMATVVGAAEIPSQVYIDRASGTTSFVVVLPSDRQIYVECSADGCTADDIPPRLHKRVPKEK